jgi:hypothetical protein
MLCSVTCKSTLSSFPGPTFLAFRVFIPTADGSKRNAVPSSRGHCLGTPAYGLNVILHIHCFEYSNNCEFGHLRKSAKLSQLSKLLRNWQTRRILLLHNLAAWFSWILATLLHLILCFMCKFNPLVLAVLKRCIAYCDICTVHLLLFCTVANKCTIISQIITLLHVSTLSCHPQGACNQYLAKLQSISNAAVGDTIYN